MSYRALYFFLISLFIVGASLLFSFSAHTQTSPQEVVGLVRQDCTGYSNCYTSLSAWETAYGGVSFGSCPAGDLVCANIRVTAQIDGVWTTADTTPLLIDGWTTDASHTITIFTAPTARHSGVWNTNAYRLSANASTGVIKILESNTTLDGLQVENTRTGSDPDGITGYAPLSSVMVKNNIVRYTGMTIGVGVGIALADPGNGTNYVVNNIVYRFPLHGIYVRGASTSAWGVVYNNTSVNNGYGFRARDGYILFKNNVGFTNASGTFFGDGAGAHANSANNAGDIGVIPGSGPVSLAGIAGTSLFQDFANNNFHILSSSILASAGADLSSDSLFALTADIDGQTRTTLYDIGADETSGGSTPPPTGDTTAPAVSMTAPTSGTTVSGSATTVSANASDNIGVSGVQFLLDGANLGSEDTTSPYSVTWNTTQSTNAFHTLSARARDVAGNLTTSGGVTITVSNTTPTPDTQAPSTPTNLTATPFSSSQINLSWTASMDNVGVAGYRIYRNNVEITTTTGTSYSNTGLTANTTYTYAISAYDAASNGSPATANVSATTQSGTTPPPTGAANYPLQITQPQVGLTTISRYYKAYPGILYKVPVGIFGGAYPFTYSLPTAPSGMTINASTGIISWPNPVTTGSPHPITVRVSDAAGTAVIRSWTITVTTVGFVFIDAVNGTHASGFGCSVNCGTGTIMNPFRSMIDVYQGTTDPEWRNTLFNDQFIYWRAGTYGLEGLFESSGQQYQMEWRGNYKPHVWLAYPGETVVIDHSLSPGSNGAFLDWRDGDSSDAFIHGIRFQNMLNHAFRMGGSPRTVFFENRFENFGPGRDGDNSSFIMYASLSPNEFHLVKDNTFNNCNACAYIKTYTTRYTVFEGNIFTNPVGSTEGLALKSADQYVDIRGNTFDGNFTAGSISGNWASGGNFEIRFNKILNAASQFSSSVYYGGLTINYNGTPSGPAYIYRNTIEGIVTVRFGNTGDGPFHLYNNVIVNENSGIPEGSHISHVSVTDPSVIILSNNLVGFGSNNIIDANGNLASAYASYLGTHGYQLGSGGSTPPPPPADTTAPTVSMTAPTSGTTVSGTTVTVSGNASDNIGVSGVQFLLDGVNLGAEDTTSPYSITWNTTQATNASHTLSARARDAAGNQTTSGGVTVTVNNATTDIQAPTTPTNLTATAISSSQINLAWTASTDNVGVTGYHIYRNSILLQDVAGTTFQNTGLTANTTYAYSIASFDAASNGSSATAGVSVTTQSGTTLPPPSGQLLLFDNFEYPVTRADPNACNIFISGVWDSCKVQPTLENYLFTTTSIPGFSGTMPGTNSSRVLALEAMTSRGQTDFYIGYGNPENPADENKIPADVWFQFWMYTNHSGNQLSQIGGGKWIYPCNGPYPCNSGRWLFQIKPSVANPLSRDSSPSSVAFPYGNPTQGEAFLLQSDNQVGTVNYSLTDPWNSWKLGQFTISEYLRPNRWNLVKVHYDTSNPASGKYEAWIQPQGGQFTKVAEWIGGITPNFTWTFPTAGGHRGFRMPTTIGHAVNGGSDQWFYMDDFAMASSESALPTYSGSTPPPTSDTQAPSTPTNLTATPLSSSQINLSWTASTDNVAVTGYHIYRNNVEIATPVGTSYQNTGLTANTTYTYAISAYDVASNGSPATANVSATTLFALLPPDTITPATVTLTATNTTSNQTTLTFTAPGDDGSVGTASFYDIRYSTTPLTLANWDSANQAAGEPTPRIAGIGESFTLANLSPSTTYYISLRSTDDALNLSPLSNVVTVVTLVAPTTPPPTTGGGGTPTVTVVPPSGGGGGGSAPTYVTNPGATSALTPTLIRDLSQHTSTGLSLPEQGIVTGPTLTIKGYVFTGDGAPARLEVEMKPFASTFNATTTLTSTLVPSGTSTALTILTPTAQGLYKFRARTVSQTGSTSPWLEFGSPLTPDFMVLRTAQTPTPRFTKLLKLGMRDPEVSLLQQTLKNLNLYTGLVGGYFGTLTRTSVIAFQKKYGLPPVGQVGPATRIKLNALVGTAPSTPSSFTRSLSLGSKGEDVKLMQTILIQQGFLTGTADGVFGPKTKSAVIKFQQRYNLQPPRGYVGPATRAKLGELGR